MTRPEGCRLLAAAPEDEGVAALQPNDPQPGQAAGNQACVDARLRHRRRALALADIHHLRAGADQAQHRAARQGVVQHKIGLTQRLGGTNRQQTGIARPSAHQPDLAGTRPGPGGQRGGVIHHAETPL